MKIEKWICVALFVLMPDTTAISADDDDQAPADTATQEQTRECNSCTLRHQALLKKKKLRERKKALEATDAAKSKKDE